jgi:hypothetical protein
MAKTRLVIALGLLACLALGESTHAHLRLSVTNIESVLLETTGRQRPLF